MFWFFLFFFLLESLLDTRQSVKEISIELKQVLLKLPRAVAAKLLNPKIKI